MTPAEKLAYQLRWSSSARREHDGDPPIEPTAEQLRETDELNWKDGERDEN